jgi:hypothetical protein
MQPRIALHEAGRSPAVRRHEEEAVHGQPRARACPRCAPEGENRTLTTKRSRAYCGVDLQRCLVGATGFEPVTSSVSANHREPLCGRPFSQVAPDRRGRS